MPLPKLRAPPPAIRCTSSSGCRAWKAGQRGISQRIRRVGSQESTSDWGDSAGAGPAPSGGCCPAPSDRLIEPFTRVGQKDPALAPLEQHDPRSSSSSRTARLMAPWVRCSSSAARPKCSVRAATSKQRRAVREGSERDFCEFFHHSCQKSSFVIGVIGK